MYTMFLFLFVIFIAETIMLELRESPAVPVLRKWYVQSPIFATILSIDILLFLEPTLKHFFQVLIPGVLFFNLNVIMAPPLIRLTPFKWNIIRLSGVLTLAAIYLVHKATN